MHSDAPPLDFLLSHTESPWEGGRRVRFFVPGKVEPAGSKRAVPLRGVRGQRAIVIDANKRAPEWKNRVGSVARSIADRPNPPFDGPVAVRMDFYQARPKSHYRTGRNSSLLRADAPLYPVGRPDALKLARGTEDALTGVLWTDDSRIVVEQLRKLYTSSDQPEIGAHIVVEEIIR